ncbi:restriction endonuclease [Pseudomonas granadensis]|uniref:nSTAND3 domain-containing NTPase n=1 Tax=Pseudomonas granadensis TaxID=1421430 RepID=UPI0019D246EA|nr:restriction endonuclease [Pseudomonas granadensis]MBN6774217.1 restriction endonuclease [Pseudomonas granadensis]MBN6805309.1 restriction endonuclease [Pseudomonas granadensis]MBN6832243.1 restriction endonuclease [Pseudomonas granadensis]MBN6839503.1 restriction endonuclease [Pseudomonas granadensis]MBN6868666.1 restriction endonuclease [Pseudomonas granadensis]
MNDYNFSRLNDKEFEVLCTDLIGASEGVRFERFKAGRDGGVDGRYFSPNGGEWILQAKHRPASSFSKLVAHVRSSEAPKVAALKPERYVLVVSHPLSRSTKDELIEALGAPCPVSVYGKEDLNDLLALHPRVEQRHFKLWISSATVLVHLLNNAIMGRSDAMMIEIVEKSKIFVQTRNFEWAVHKLNQLGTVIITGQAGIGKTTLAEQLILFYAKNGFEFLSVSHDIHEAEQAYMLDRPQLFYFDDFLGKNYLEALSGHEGSQIVNFIKRIHRDRATKKFVLTSRSTILNQGRILNDAFENGNVNRNEMEIKLQSLSSLDKAHILYNHIWHSGLSPEHVESFYVDKRYHRVIGHRNFNPRIIQFITDPQRLVDIPAEAYWNHITNLLDNPTRIWEHPFDAQLDDFGRFLVLLVAFNGNEILEQDLAKAYAVGLRMPEHASFKGKREFGFVVRHLSNSLLTRVMAGEKRSYKLFNPSLGDFLLHRYAKDSVLLETLFKCLRSLNTIKILQDMTRNEDISGETAMGMRRSLFEHEESLGFEGSPPEYLAKLYINTQRGLSEAELIRRIKNVTAVILSNPVTRNCESCLVTLADAVNEEIATPAAVEKYVLDVINLGVDEKDLPALGDLIGLLELNDADEATEPFTRLAHQFMSDSLDEMFEESIVFSEGEDVDAANRTLLAMIDEKFTSWQVSVTNSMKDEIVNAYDIPYRMENYFNEEENYVSPRAEQSRLEALDIDDLFSRERL